MTKALVGTALTIAFLAFGVLASAQSGGGRRPPPEAFEACEGKAEGDSCSVDTPRGTLEGTCKLAPKAEELLCVPNDFGDRRPPR